MYSPNSRRSRFSYRSWATARVTRTHLTRRCPSSKWQCRAFSERHDTPRCAISSSCFPNCSTLPVIAATAYHHSRVSAEWLTVPQLPRLLRIVVVVPSDTRNNVDLNRLRVTPPFRAKPTHRRFPGKKTKGVFRPNTAPPRPSSRRAHSLEENRRRRDNRVKDMTSNWR